MQGQTGNVQKKGNTLKDNGFHSPQLASALLQLSIEFYHRKYSQELLKLLIILSNMPSIYEKEYNK